MLLRVPFTLVFLATMVLANYLAGTLSGALPVNILTRWGIGHGTILNGELYRLVTGTFLSHDLGMFLRQFAFAATVIGYVEWKRGSGKAMALFFSLDIVGTVILLGLFLWWQPPEGLPNMYDVGMSIGGFALIGLSIAAMPKRWLLLIGILSAIALKFSIAPDLLADCGHFLALILGFGLGSVLAHIP